MANLVLTRQDIERCVRQYVEKVFNVVPSDIKRIHFCSDGDVRIDLKDETEKNVDRFHGR